MRTLALALSKHTARTSRPTAALACVVWLLPSLGVSGCSEYDLLGKDDSPRGGRDGKGNGDGDGDPDGDSDDTAMDAIDEGPPPGGSVDPMYAHSGGVLFSVSPLPPYGVTRIGAFHLPNGNTPAEITDLAVDDDGYMYAIGYSKFYKVDPSNAEVELMSEWSHNTNALSFAGGILVAGDADRLLRVDPVNGSVRSAGRIGNWSFAGDMVGLPDGMLYCAMTQGFSSQSYLVVYDPVADVIVDERPTGVGALYGVGYAEQTLFGFSSDGTIHTIHPNTGRATVVANPGFSFYGAATNPALWP